jgi:metal-responsive CopG/Arc/MetJ family transcriptional regulator
MATSTNRRVHVSLPREDLDRLDRGAKAEGLSRSAFVKKLMQWKAAGYPDGFWEARVEPKE